MAFLYIMLCPKKGTLLMDVSSLQGPSEGKMKEEVAPRLRILFIGYNIKGPVIGGTSRISKEMLQRLSTYDNIDVCYEQIPQNIIKQLTHVIRKRESFRRSGFDIIHCLGEGPALTGMVLSRILRKPLVVTFFSSHTDELMSVGIGGISISTLLEIFLEKLKVFFANAVIVTSNWQKKRMKLGKKGYVIYPGVDHITEGILRKMRDFEKRDDSAVCVTGPLVEYRSRRKGIDVLLEIARSMPSIRIYVVGKHTDSLKSRYNDIPKNIVLKECPPDDELYTLMSRCKFIIAPSRHEAFSITSLEGMRLGCIPLVSKFCGIQELLREFGFILDLDPKVFSDKLLSCLANPQRAQEQSSRLVEIAISLIWEKCVLEHLALYSKIYSSVSYGMR